MKRIGIDCRFAGVHCGLGRYTSELVHHLLLRNDSVHYVLFVRSTEEHWISKLHGSPEICVADISHYSFAEQLVFPRILKRAKLDLLFSPHFNVPLFCPVAFVVTTHDLILHHFPNEASMYKQAAYKILMNRSVKRSRAIIAVSNFVSKEIASMYGKKVQKKLVTIYEGVSSKFTPASAYDVDRSIKKYGIRQPYLLYVGNAKQHKNVQMLLDAYYHADTDLSLVLISGVDEVRSLHMPNGVQVLTNVTDDDLPALYSGASAFVTASQYEGFGLPIVESQACGTPVIAIDISSIPEVADESGMLVPLKLSALSDAIRNAGSLLQPMKNTFTWQKAAQQTYEVLAMHL